MNTVAPVRSPQSMVASPIDAIMRMLRGTLFGRVCDELRHNLQTVADLTFFLVLGMSTLACQDGTYVRLRDGTLVPLTGYFFVSAPPGCGKSTLLHRLLAPFMKAEEEAAEESAAQARRHKAESLIWRAKVRDLTREVTDAVSAGDDTAFLGFKLGLTFPEEPRAPLTASWLVEDTTIHALRRRLHKVWPSAGIVLDEGIRFFTSPLSRAFADLCTLWDARLARNDRVTTGSESIARAFLSMIVATQWEPLLSYLKEYGQKIIDTGLGGRVQLLDVSSPIPPRVLDGRSMRNEALSEFDDRVLFLKRDARKRMKDGVFEPVFIDMSEEAASLLAGVPLMIRAGSYPADMGPYMLRLPMLITRIAGVLHRFEGYAGEISADTMRCAMEIGFWLAQQTGSVLMRRHEPSPAELADMDAAVQMLRSHAYIQRRAFITKSELRELAPRFQLDEDRCKRAIRNLCKAAWVWLESRGSGEIVRLSPQHFHIS